MPDDFDIERFRGVAKGMSDALYDMLMERCPTWEAFLNYNNKIDTCLKRAIADDDRERGFQLGCTNLYLAQSFIDAWDLYADEVDADSEVG